MPQPADLDPPLSLVVMAAGLGSRFGGTKQLAAVGPDGEAFLDFSIADAVAAGVEKVVLVVRTDIEADVARHVEPRHPDVAIAYVRQDEHGPPRPKPWGTGHAVLVAAAEVAGPFMVCNADDYYGRRTYADVAPLAADLAPDRALLAGFRMGQTLPSSGAVSRGVCRVEAGELRGLVETHGIARGADGAISAADPPGPLHDDTIASMNFWAFPHRLFDELEVRFERFLAEGRGGPEPGAEFLLPSVVQELMHEGKLSVGVVPTDEPWVGVTNPDDLDVARTLIAELRA